MQFLKTRGFREARSASTVPKLAGALESTFQLLSAYDDKPLKPSRNCIRLHYVTLYSCELLVTHWIGSQVGPFCSSCLSMAGENCCTSAFLLLTLRRPTDPAQKHFSRLYATYTPPSTVGDREGWGWVHLGCFPTKVVAEC